MTASGSEHAKGDEARFRDLYAAHYRRVLAYATRRIEPAEEAHDVTSETFAVAWRRLDEVPTGDGAGAWLIGTARRILANHRRGHARWRHLQQRLRSQVHDHAGSQDPTASMSGVDEHKDEASP